MTAAWDKPNEISGLHQVELNSSPISVMVAVESTTLNF